MVRLSFEEQLELADEWVKANPVRAVNIFLKGEDVYKYIIDANQEDVAIAVLDYGVLEPD